MGLQVFFREARVGTLATNKPYLAMGISEMAADMRGVGRPKALYCAVLCTSNDSVDSSLSSLSSFHALRLRTGTR